VARYLLTLRAPRWCRDAELEYDCANSQAVQWWATDGRTPQERRLHALLLAWSTVGCFTELAAEQVPTTPVAEFLGTSVWEQVGRALRMLVVADLPEPAWRVARALAPDFPGTPSALAATATDVASTPAAVAGMSHVQRVPVVDPVLRKFPCTPEDDEALSEAIMDWKENVERRDVSIGEGFGLRSEWVEGGEVVLTHRIGGRLMLVDLPFPQHTDLEKVLLVPVPHRWSSTRPGRCIARLRARLTPEKDVPEDTTIAEAIAEARYLAGGFRHGVSTLPGLRRIERKRQHASELVDAWVASGGATPEEREICALFVAQEYLRLRPTWTTRRPPSDLTVLRPALLRLAVAHLPENAWFAAQTLIPTFTGTPDELVAAVQALTPAPAV